MNKLTNFLLMLLVSLLLENLNAATATAGSPVMNEAPEAKKINGKTLLEEDERQISLLEEKLQEAQSKGAEENTLLLIKSYIDLAKEMKDLNNKRHALHDAVRGFEKGVAIFSEEIKGIVAKVNEILTAQSDVAIRNAQLRNLLGQPQQSATDND